MKKTAFALLCALALGQSCSQDQATARVADSPVPATLTSAVSESAQPLSVEADAIYLERMYATNTGHGRVENLLDGDLSTTWQPPRGAGLDEGIMLYFDPPQYIGKVTVRRDTEVPSLKELEIFVNGSLLNMAEPDRPASIGQEVSALFFRISYVEGAQEETYFIDHGRGTFASLPASFRTGLSELEFTGRDGQPLKLRALAAPAGNASASSTLAPASAYHADFLFDSRNEFGWAEGDAGNGVGQAAYFEFQQPVRIEKIKLWNGYQRSESHYQSNCRAKQIAFGTKGSPQGSYAVRDEASPQVISLSQPVEGRSFELLVKEVYPGAAYKDLVLSELRFYDGQRWFGMSGSGVASRQEEIRKSVAGSSIAPILDRSLTDSWGHDVGDNAYRSHTRKLILRSNGTFVMYLGDNERTDKVANDIQQVADGNWEIVEAAKGNSRVKIFGKIHRIQDHEKFYVGKSQNEKTRIFKEFLTIDGEWVRGEKLLDSLRTRIGEADMVPCGKYADMEVHLKYLSDDNFMKEYLYDDCQECFVREATARALGKAAQLLREENKNYRLLIWDAYRPYSVQKRMWEKIKDPRYVADPYNGGSSHNKGAAVDITITHAGSGEVLSMGTDHDHFGEEAHWSYTGLTAEEAANRALLKRVMEGAGFQPLSTEWWHFSLKGAKFPIADIDPERCYP